MQRPLGNVCVDGEAFVLLVVAGVVLDTGHHVFLHSSDQRHTHGAHVNGILTVCLLRPAPGRVSQKIDTDAGKKIGPLSASFPCDRFTDLRLHFGIPGRASRHGHREAGRIAHHDPAGTVAKADAPNASVGKIAGDDWFVIIGKEQVKHTQQARTFARQ